MRDYLSVSETSKIIASEVIETGTSKNWARVDNNTLNLAMEIEKHLSKFNIGYTDPTTGTWKPKRDGTRYFSSMNLMGVAKNKMGSLISLLKKQ